MTKTADPLAWKLAGGIAVGAATLLAKKALDGTWQLATGNPPPTDPEDTEVAWGEAIGWALLSGAVIGLAQLLAARGAARYVRQHRV